MAEFRYYCLHDDGAIALGEHTEVTDLNAAIDHVYEVARSHPKGAFHFVEVWTGTERLYASPRSQGQARSISGPDSASRAGNGGTSGVMVPAQVSPLDSDRVRCAR
jgi:hypothetical protein